MSPKRLGVVIRTKRQAAGLTQAELAKRARVTQGYVAQIEGGRKKSPSLESLRRLAKALGVTVAELLQ